MKGWGWSQWTEWDGCFFFIISRFSTFVTFFQPTSFVYFRCGSCPRPACPSSCRMRCRWRQEGLLSLLKGSLDILMIEISQVLPWSLRWAGQLCGNMFYSEACYQQSFDSAWTNPSTGWIYLQASQMDRCPSLSPLPLSSSPHPMSTTTHRPLPDQGWENHSKFFTFQNRLVFSVSQMKRIL